MFVSHKLSQKEKLEHDCTSALLTLCVESNSTLFFLSFFLFSFFFFFVFCLPLELHQVLIDLIASLILGPHCMV
jgi:hypothetical protein